MEKREKFLILLLIVAVVFTRLFFAFQSSDFNKEAYFDLRQISSVRNEGGVIYKDSLSYGGRENIFLPLYYHVVGFFNLFVPLGILVKTLSSLLMGGLVFLVYLIGKKLTGNKRASFMAALGAGFVPISYAFIFSAGKELFSFGLIFLAIYFFLNIKEKRFVYFFVGTVILLALTSLLGWLLVLGLLIYLLLSVLEGFKVDKSEVELIIFSFLFYSWVQFLFFRKALVVHGWRVFWKNMPRGLLVQSIGFNLVFAFVAVGLVALVAGVFVAYLYLFKKQDKKMSFVLSLILLAGFLPWNGFLKETNALLFLGLLLAILLAPFYKGVVFYLSQTKMFKVKFLVPWVMIILLAVTSAFPFSALAWDERNNILQGEEKEAYFWLKENTGKSDVVLTSLSEGHLITFLAQRKNVFDNNFLLAEDANNVYEDVEKIFKTRSLTEAVELLNKYSVDYIFFSDQIREDYDVEKLRFKDLDCVEEKKEDIFKISCRIVLS